MNFWDVIIIVGVVAVAVFGMVRAKRHGSCHGGCCCGCDSCPHADGCRKKGNSK
ncbi:MAG: hypothetical protein J5800_07700 [Spirochaetales bacterium]|nr:hypothetical protein [Spirochaetales bacterium]